MKIKPLTICNTVTVVVPLYGGPGYVVTLFMHLYIKIGLQMNKIFHGSKLMGVRNYNTKFSIAGLRPW